MSTNSGQLALMIDLERCTGCKSCEAACKQTNAPGMCFCSHWLGQSTTLPPGIERESLNRHSTRPDIAAGQFENAFVPHQAGSLKT